MPDLSAPEVDAGDVPAGVVLLVDSGGEAVPDRPASLVETGDVPARVVTFKDVLGEAEPMRGRLVLDTGELEVVTKPESSVPDVPPVPVTEPDATTPEMRPVPPVLKMIVMDVVAGMVVTDSEAAKPEADPGFVELTTTTTSEVLAGRPVTEPDATRPDAEP